MRRFPPCPDTVYFWDGEYEGPCLRPEGHEMPHCDGDYHWDNEDSGAAPAHEPHTHEEAS